MTTRSVAITTFVSLALCCTALAALAQSRRAEPAPPAASRRCVGVSTAILRTQDPVITRVYRAFEDGTVETYDDGAAGPQWTPIR